MTQPRRPLPERARDIPWAELRRHATTVFTYLQAGWAALSEAERREAGRLITKSRGRPRNLTKEEARRLGVLASKAAAAARRAGESRP